MRKLKIVLFVLLCLLVPFFVGMRDRYGPATWQNVSGGIQYTQGNVAITAGDFSVSGAAAITGAITEGGIAVPSIADMNTSAEILAIVEDETGTGVIVFGTAPTISNPTVSGVMTIATDIYPACRTVIKTIDANDDDSTDDFQFDNDVADQAEQSVDLGAIVPAYAEVVSVQLRCFETLTNSGAMSIDLGLAAGDAEYLAAANIDTANDIDGTATGVGPKLEASNAARKVFINATPDADWDTLFAGRWAVMVTYLDYGAIYTKDSP